MSMEQMSQELFAESDETVEQDPSDESFRALYRHLVDTTLPPESVFTDLFASILQKCSLAE